MADSSSARSRRCSTFIIAAVQLRTSRASSSVNNLTYGKPWSSRLISQVRISSTTSINLGASSRGGRWRVTIVIATPASPLESVIEDEFTPTTWTDGIFCRRILTNSFFSASPDFIAFGPRSSKHTYHEIKRQSFRFPPSIFLPQPDRSCARDGRRPSARRARFPACRSRRPAVRPAARARRRM